MDDTKAVIKTENTGIKLADISKEMRDSYINYSMSVIVARALPDVRDGLKPVHRRILYAMYELNLHYNSAYKKSAKTVGDVIGKYHPHGDVAVYDALVRMAQDFNMRYPLIDGQGNFGCFTGDTKVKLTDGRSLSFEELVKEDKEGKKNWTFAFNTKEGVIEIAEIKKPRLTKKQATLIEVSLDNGEKVTCTPNHRFMLRDGTYTEAQNLKAGFSLMPIYTKQYKGTKDANLKGYEILFQPIKKQWEFIHHLADQWNLKNDIYIKNTGRVRHHIDFNKYNNNPTNIIRMAWEKHWKLHSDMASWRHKNDPLYVKKIEEGRNKYIKENKDYKEKMRELSKQNLLNLWKDESFKKKIGKLKRDYLLKRWEDKDYREKMTKQLRENSIKMWQNPTHRKHISDISKQRTQTEEYKKLQSLKAKAMWKDPNYKLKFSSEHFSKIANKLWSNPETKILHSNKMRKQLENPEFKAKIISSVIDSNKRRLEKNPKMMKELSTKAIKALHEKWKDPLYKEQVIRTKILRFTSSLLVKYSSIAPEIYEAERTNNGVPTISKALMHFKNFNDLKKQSKTYNHKVVSVKFLDKKEDVYDLTIDKFHNFSLDSGIFVHNSIDGDSPAAMRYTESRLQKVTEEILKDLDKETVDFVENYDGSETEPSVLPAVLPNLLLNGADGIAVGMATKIPPHNLGEMVDSLLHVIQQGNQYQGELKKGKFPRFETKVEVDQLMKFVKGPDFPTGGIIYNKEDIKNMYATGRGRIVMRAVVNIEELKTGKSHIVVSELPYQVNKARLASRIAELVKSEKITGISDIRDESNRNGMNLVIEVKKEGNPQNILNLLYKHTEMQSAFNANILALVDGEPKILTLKNILEEFITHRQEIVIRRTEYDLRKAKERAHILEGLLIALDHLDEVISIIRNSPDADVAKERLITSFKLSDIQAQAILDMQLRKLAALERKKIEDEYKQLIILIAKLEKILSTPSMVLDIIGEELLKLKESFADKRRTKVISGKVGELTEIDTIVDEETIITISKRGYIKRIHPDSYKIQNRGGKGIIATKTQEEDFVNHVLLCNTHSDILFFSNKGKVYQLKCYDIPQAQRTSKGVSLINLIKLESGELITSILTKDSTGYKENIEVLSEDRKKSYKYLFMATKKGIVKKTELKHFEDIRRNGVIAIVLEKDDELTWVKLTTGDDQIMLISKKAHSIRFKEEDVRETGRATMGVRGIKIKSDDYVIGMDIIRGNNSFIFTISENGYGKMTKIEEYATQGRGGQGVLTARVNNKNGDLVTGRGIQPTDTRKEIIILSRKGHAIRISLDEIPEHGRQTSGVKLMNLSKEDKVAAITVL